MTPVINKHYMKDPSREKHYVGDPPLGALTVARLEELPKSGVVYIVFPQSVYDWNHGSFGIVKCPLTTKCISKKGGTNPEITVGRVSYWSDHEYLCYGFGQIDGKSFHSAWGFENYWFALAHALRLQRG